MKKRPGRIRAAILGWLGLLSTDLLAGLSARSTSGRAAFYAAMVNNGVLTRDEVRELEDRQAMGGNAGVLTVQSAMTTLDSIGTTSDAEAARATLQAFLEAA